MNIELSANEARVIGCLLEKEVTTPDQYPLSLNALTNACNQKTNRDPVLELSETAVQQTVDSLMKKYLFSFQWSRNCAFDTEYLPSRRSNDL